MVPRYSYANYAGNATNVVSAAGTSGVLHSIVVNKAVLSTTITVYDNGAASGTKIATITHPGTLLQSQYVLDFDVAFTTGLTVVTSGADDITVCWRRDS